MLFTLICLTYDEKMGGNFNLNGLNEHNTTTNQQIFYLTGWLVYLADIAFNKQ